MATPTGFDTMSPEMIHAWRYHRWVYEHFREWVRGRVLEVGAGHGIYTSFLSEDADCVVATDLDERSLNLARARASDAKVSFRRLDLLDQTSVENLGGTFDTIVCLNVLEHIREDKDAVRSMAGVTNRGGHLVIVTPAFEWLFSPLDEYAGHFRRYTRQTLTQVLESAGLSVVRARYFNALGVLGWAVYGKIVRPKAITEPSVGSAVRFFDRTLVPVAKIADALTFHSFGSSVLAVARKG